MPDYQTTVQQVLERADIVELLGEYLPLSANGNNFVALCPFHQDKRPSMHVVPSKQIFKCFACGAGGDVINFVRNYEKVSFAEALQKLAVRYQVALPDQNKTTPAHAQIQAQQESLKKLLLQVCVFWQNQLTKSPSTKEYIKKRRISQSLIDRFALGYAAYECEVSLQDYGSVEQLKLAGVLNEKQRSRMIHRLIFPIRDIQGKVIAFGGRTLGDKQPKYLNSPETPLFNKSRVLYGLYEALQNTRNPKRIYLVEGYMDVIAMHAAGLENVVACMGTGLTKEHWQLLFRYTKEVILCFDGDAAGRKASAQAVAACLPFLRVERTVRIALLPLGQDPDTMRGTATDMAQHLSALSQPLSSYLLHHYNETLAYDTPEARARAIATIAPLLASMPGGVLRTMILNHLAEYTHCTIQLVDEKPYYRIARLHAYAPIKQPYHEKRISAKLTHNPIDELSFFILHNLQHLPLLDADYKTALQDRGLQDHTPDAFFTKIEEITRKNPQANTSFVLGALETKQQAYAQKILQDYESYNLKGDSSINAEQCKALIETAIRYATQNKNKAKRKRLNDQVKAGASTKKLTASGNH